MSGLGRDQLQRRAVADHDIAGLQFGARQRLAELRDAGAQLIGGRGPLRPHPHRGAFAVQAHQRMDRAGRT